MVKIIKHLLKLPFYTYFFSLFCFFFIFIFLAEGFLHQNQSIHKILFYLPSLLWCDKCNTILFQRADVKVLNNVPLTRKILRSKWKWSCLDLVQRLQSKQNLKDNAIDDDSKNDKTNWIRKGYSGLLISKAKTEMEFHWLNTFSDQLIFKDVTCVAYKYKCGSG